VPAPPYYPSAERGDDVVPFQELSHYGGAGAVYSLSSGSQSGTIRKKQKCHETVPCQILLLPGKR